ncbi:Ral GTPase-activating protein subunit alpha-2 [Chytriomyces hyalinus]|nr:Ral GTPase-activating protein subunit alpha-2 [Chytriomyces hyalinus]
MSALNEEVGGKRLDKLMKKAKQFLDEKQKAKSRLASLYSFLDSMTPFPATAPANGSNSSAAPAADSALNDALVDQQILCKFFSEYCAQVFAVLLECFNHQAEKLRGKEKSDKSGQVSSKELTDMTRIVSTLRRFLIHVPHKLEAGWEKSSICKITQSLLAQGNHARLRMEGIKLLLVWINHLAVISREEDASGLGPTVERLYSTAINLSVFEAPPTPAPIDLAKSDCLGSDILPGISTKFEATPDLVSKQKLPVSPDDTPCIYPSPTYPTEADSIELIEEVLSNIQYLGILSCTQPMPNANTKYGHPMLQHQNVKTGAAISSHSEESETEWQAFLKTQSVDVSATEKLIHNRGAFVALITQLDWVRKMYFPLLFPSAKWRISGILVEGFSMCPTEILQSILVFLTRQTVDTGANATQIIESNSLIPITINSELSFRMRKLFQAILWNQVEHREFAHEAVRQGLMTPWLNSELGRYSMFILRSWAFVPLEERSALYYSKTETEDGSLLPSSEIMNLFLRRHVRFIQLLFLDKKDYVEYVDHQMILWREGFQFFRLVSLEMHQFHLTAVTWDCLLAVITDIIDHILCRPNKYAGVSSPPDADEICDLAIETLFCVLIRCPTSTEFHWQRLRDTLSKCSRWNQVTGQYVKIVLKLTRALCIRVFAIDNDLLSKEDLDAKTPSRFRTVSVHAARLKSTSGSFSSQISGKSGRLLASSPLAETFEMITSQVVSEPRHSRTASEEAEHESVVPSLVGSKRADSGFRKTEVSVVQTIKDSNRVSNSSIGSLHSVEGSSERFLERTYQPFATAFKIPPLSIILQARLESFSNFINLAATWFPEWTYAVWKNSLCILGDVSKIASPSNHADVIRCLLGIFDSFEKIRAVQPYESLLMPNLFEFSPWMFETCDLSSEYTESKMLAYGLVCRTMCRRHDQTLPVDCLPQFYRILLKGLDSEDVRIPSSILTNAETIFTSLLPGCHILIPSFIATVKRMFLTGNKEVLYLPANVRECSIRILLSLLPVRSQISGFQKDGCVPVLKKMEMKTSWSSLHRTGSESISNKSSVHMLEIHEFLEGNLKLRIQIKDILCALLAQERDPLNHRKNSDTHLILLWGVTALAFEEMISTTNPSGEIIDDCLINLLDHLTLTNIETVSTCIDGLHLFAKESSLLDYIWDARTSSKVIKKLLDATTEHLIYAHAKPNESKDIVISKLLNCLCGWILISETKSLSSLKTATTVFDVLEQVLRESEQEPENSDNNNNQLVGKTQRSDASLFGSAGKLPVATATRQSTLVSGEDEYEINMLKEAVENTVAHVLHHYSNFSPPYGPVLLSSQLCESFLNDERIGFDKIMLFGANDNSVMTFQDISEPEFQLYKTRATARDTSGRYVWDNSLFYQQQEPDAFLDEETDDKTVGLLLEGSIELASSRLQIQEDAFDSDKLSTLLFRVGNTHADCLLQEDIPLNETVPVFSPTANAVFATTAEIEEHIKHEVETAATLVGSMEGVSKNAVSASSATETNINSTTRLFLNHLGHFNFDSLKDGYFFHFSKTASLGRDLRGLDKKYGRETIKVAIIYVGPGQEDETSILRNQSASNEYKQFVASLGWEIDVGAHNGYLGGLEKNLTSGAKALYYCDQTVEMIFHDVINMPSDAMDPKQVKKKRHIGNDHVHIIWNDHYRQYRKNTIGGDFGNAQIVVTPNMNELYEVSVNRDSKIGYFGPLQNHVMVSKPALGPLVRNTAINAYRRALNPGPKHKLHSHPSTQRSNDISTILSRHKASKFTFESYLSCFS